MYFGTLEHKLFCYFSIEICPKLLYLMLTQTTIQYISSLTHNSLAYGQSSTIVKVLVPIRRLHFDRLLKKQTANNFFGYPICLQNCSILCLRILIKKI